MSDDSPEIGPTPVRPLGDRVVRLATSALFQGAIAFMALQVGANALAFLTQVLLARTVDARSFGVFSYAVGWVAFLSPIASLGLSTSSIRFVAGYLGTGDAGSLRGFVRTTTLLVGVASVSMAIALASLASFMVRSADAAEVATLRFAAVALPPMALVALSAGGLRGLQHVSRSQLPLLIHQAAFGLCLVAAIFVRDAPLGAPQAAMAYALGAFVSLLVSNTMFRRAMTVVDRSPPSTSDSDAWIRVSLPILLFSTLQLLRTRTGVLIVGAYEDPSDVGYFAAATRFANLAALALTAVAAWASPRISTLYHAGDEEGLKNLVRQAARVTVLLTVPVAGAFMVLGPWLLGLFGPEFSAGYASLAILMIGQVAAALVGPVGFLMTMTRFQAHAAWIEGTLAVFYVGLSLYLVPMLGIEGAAWAITAVNTARSLLMMVIVWREMRIRSFFL